MVPRARLSEFTLVILLLAPTTACPASLTWSTGSRNLIWGDYDNDGLIDLAVTGATDNEGMYVSKVYRNDGNAQSFTDIGAGLQGMYWSSIAWGDYNVDDKLDLLVGGSAPNGPQTLVYRNTAAVPSNRRPSQPANLRALRFGGWVTLSWDAATDPENPGGRGLSYNVRVGTTPYGNEKVSCMTAQHGGGGSDRRMVMQIGNAQKKTSWMFKVDDGVTYYWDVSAIDAAYGTTGFNGNYATIGIPTAVDEGYDAIEACEVVGPNPGRRGVAFKLSSVSEAQVDVAIYDVQGRCRGVCARGLYSAGMHRIEGDLERYGVVESGVFFAVARIGKRTFRERFVVLR